VSDECFSGAHGVTGTIQQDDLAHEAARFRYRVVIRRQYSPVPQTFVSETIRKRQRDSAGDDRQKKRAREEVIELSSDGEEVTLEILPGPSTSQDKGKGKAIEVEEKPGYVPLDLQEELECFICSTLMVVPYICSPCGHGACGPCIFKWKERSNTCPQCRANLSTEEPFIRDYVLERITQKYSKTVLTEEELLERENQATYLPVILD